MLVKMESAPCKLQLRRPAANQAGAGPPLPAPGHQAQTASMPIVKFKEGEMIPDMSLSSSLYNAHGPLASSASNTLLPPISSLAQHASVSSVPRLRSAATALSMSAGSDLPGRLAAAIKRPVSNGISSAGGVSTALSLLVRGGALRGGGGTPKLDLDRVAFRLEGMEIYSLVMALFMGAALTLLGATNIKIHPWKEMKESKSKLAESIASCLFYVFCTYAVISSGFTTILFTLTSLYCKTAVGMGTDDRYLAFLDATGMIRFFGFNAFMRSITTFCISFIFSTFLNCEGRLRWVVPLIPSFATWVYWGKLSTLINAATAIIFAPPS